MANEEQPPTVKAVSQLPLQLHSHTVFFDLPEQYLRHGRTKELAEYQRNLELGNEGSAGDGPSASGPSQEPGNMNIGTVSVLSNDNQHPDPRLTTSQRSLGFVPQPQPSQSQLVPAGPNFSQQMRAQPHANQNFFVPAHPFAYVPQHVQPQNQQTRFPQTPFNPSQLRITQTGPNAKSNHGMAIRSMTGRYQTSNTNQVGAHQYNPSSSRASNLGSYQNSNQTVTHQNRPPMNNDQYQQSPSPMHFASTVGCHPGSNTSGFHNETNRNQYYHSMNIAQNQPANPVLHNNSFEYNLVAALNYSLNQTSHRLSNSQYQIQPSSINKLVQHNYAQNEHVSAGDVHGSVQSFPGPEPTVTRTEEILTTSLPLIDEQPKVSVPSRTVLEDQPKVLSQKSLGRLNRRIRKRNEAETSGQAEPSQPEPYSVREIKDTGRLASNSIALQNVSMQENSVIERPGPESQSSSEQNQNLESCIPESSGNKKSEKETKQNVVPTASSEQPQVPSTSMPIPVSSNDQNTSTTETPVTESSNVLTKVSPLCTSKVSTAKSMVVEQLQDKKYAKAEKPLSKKQLKKRKKEQDAIENVEEIVPKNSIKAQNTLEATSSREELKAKMKLRISQMVNKRHNNYFEPKDIIPEPRETKNIPMSSTTPEVAPTKLVTKKYLVVKPQFPKMGGAKLIAKSEGLTEYDERDEINKIKELHNKKVEIVNQMRRRIEEIENLEGTSSCEPVWNSYKDFGSHFLKDDEKNMLKHINVQQSRSFYRRFIEEGFAKPLEQEYEENVIQVFIYHKNMYFLRNYYIGLHERGAHLPLFDHDITGLLKRIFKFLIENPLNPRGENQTLAAKYFEERSNHYKTKGNFHKMTIFYTSLASLNTHVLRDDATFLISQGVGGIEQEKLDHHYFKMVKEMSEVFSVNQFDGLISSFDSILSFKVRDMIPIESYEKFCHYISQQQQLRMVGLKVDLRKALLETLETNQQSMFQAYSNLQPNLTFKSELTDLFLKQMLKQIESCNRTEKSYMIAEFYKFLLNVKSRIIDQDIFVICDIYQRHPKTITMSDHQFLLDIWFGYGQIEV